MSSFFDCQRQCHTVVKAMTMMPSNDLSGAGVLIRTIEQGDCTTYPANGDSCLVHYEARLEDGKVFDSTMERNLPFRFELGEEQVMHGWEAALPHLSLGSVSELTIPAAFAYGSDGFPPYVPPNAVLIYKIQLLEIVKKKKKNKP